jgi:hypothetical protein
MLLLTLATSRICLLSTHDKAGSKYFEGKRYKDDIKTAKDRHEEASCSFARVTGNTEVTKHKVYKPRMVLTMGNHENRINRAVANTPMLDGVISTDDLDYKKDWEVYEFLNPVFINGVGFCHYFPVGAMGRAAASASVIVNKLHHVLCCWASAGKQVAYGKRADGIIAKLLSDYMGYYNHWRGLVVLRGEGWSMRCS